jgi:hypothetical protein
LLPPVGEARRASPAPYLVVEIERQHHDLIEAGLPVVRASVAARSNCAMAAWKSPWPRKADAEIGDDVRVARLQLLVALVGSAGRAPVLNVE